MACFAICFSYRFWYIFVVVVVSSKSMRYLLFFFESFPSAHEPLVDVRAYTNVKDVREFMIRWTGR